MASASANHTARVWDMTGKEVGKYVANDVVNDVVFFPDQHHLMIASQDKTVMIVDWRTGSLVETLVGHAINCYGVDFLPVSGKIVSASIDITLKIWSRKTSVKDISPNTKFGYSAERTLTGHEVRSRTHAPCSVLTPSGLCLNSERGGQRRLAYQRLQG